MVATEDILFVIVNGAYLSSGDCGMEITALGIFLHHISRNLIQISITIKNLYFYHPQLSFSLLES